MAEGWRPVFQGNIDGRDVRLLFHEPSGELRVETAQAQTEVVRGSLEPGSTVFSAVISEGDRIEIEVATADELEQELRDTGFSESGVLELMRHARHPSIPARPSAGRSRRALPPAAKPSRSAKGRKKPRTRPKPGKRKLAGAKKKKHARRK